MQSEIGECLFRAQVLYSHLMAIKICFCDPDPRTA